MFSRLHQFWQRESPAKTLRASARRKQENKALIGALKPEFQTAHQVAIAAQLPPKLARTRLPRLAIKGHCRGSRQKFRQSPIPIDLAHTKSDRHYPQRSPVHVFLN